MKSFGLQQLVVLYINWKEKNKAENNAEVNGIPTV